MSISQKTSRASENAPAPSASAGLEGITVSPPLYGIESLDSAQTGAIQMKTGSLTLPNRTGLPDALKSGVESLSGLSLDDVRVHYNSSKPAQLQALAYTQGADIHVAPGQERHLPHEAWHVVQQKQGRVQATRQMKGMAINDDSAMENEADKMGSKSLQMDARVEKPRENKSGAVVAPVLQRVSHKKRKKGSEMPSYYLDKNFSFRDKEDNEIFSQHLDDLIDGLDEDREDLRNELKRVKGVNFKTKTIKRNITEKVGELNATRYMMDNYPKTKMILGYEKGVGIDQVYEHERDGTIFVVEAKGPGAKLGRSDRKGKQMSRSWVERTAQGMGNTVVRNKILNAPKLMGLVISSTDKGNVPRRKIRPIKYW